MAVVSPVCVHVFSVDGEGACTNVYVCICVCACLLLNIFSSKSQLCCEEVDVDGIRFPGIGDGRVYFSTVSSNGLSKEKHLGSSLSNFIKSRITLVS